MCNPLRVLSNAIGQRELKTKAKKTKNVSKDYNT